MICLRCRADKCDDCLNFFNQKGEKRNPPTKTWCDCHHKTGVYIGPEHCKHLRWFEQESCPSCGKAESVPTDSGSTTATETIENLNEIVEAKELEQAVNDVSEAHNREAKAYKPTRVTLPRREKETPAS